MNKAILVIDMPENCFDCPLCINDEYGLSLECCLQYKGYVDEKGKPVWCPLKPAPEEQEVWYDDEKSDWERGYNNCVREIVGR